MSGYSRGRPESLRDIIPDAVTPIEFAVVMLDLTNGDDLAEFMRESLGLMAATLVSLGYGDGIEAFSAGIRKMNKK